MTTRARTRRTPKAPTPTNVMQDELVALNAAVTDLSAVVDDLVERADRDAGFRQDVLRAINVDGVLMWKGSRILLLDAASGKLSNGNDLPIE